MRNDVKLGFAIGGVLLAVLIVYVLVVPGGSKPRQATTTQPTRSNTANRNTATPERVTLEPVTPATPTVLPATLPAVPPPAFAENPTPAPRTDPFAPKTETAAPDPIVKATNPKSDDWNAILNQPPPMLVAQTPSPEPSQGVSTTATPPAPSTTPPAPALPAPPVPSESYSALTPPVAQPPSEPIHSSAAAPTTQTSTGTRTHRIQQGETLASISKVAYGSDKHYPAIIKANPGIDPQHLKIGASITLPEIAQPSVRPTAGEDARSASARIGSEPAIDSTKEYRVQPGDSLYKISIKLYGKSDRIEKLHQLNKKLIGEDAHRLRAGQVIQLPEPPTNTASAAR